MPVTNYIYNPLTEAYLMEQDGDGNTTVVYTQEPVKYGDVIAQHRIDPATGVGKSYYYHPDALGSTRELTDESGTVVATYNYDAFGNTIASTGTVENPFRFTGNVGYYWDEELQTYHIRARNYQPTTGRWTSQDPIGFAGGINLYGAYFVPNSTDPSGLLCDDFTDLLNAGTPREIEQPSSSMTFRRLGVDVFTAEMTDAIGHSCTTTAIEYSNIKWVGKWKYMAFCKGTEMPIFDDFPDSMSFVRSMRCKKGKCILGEPSETTKKNEKSSVLMPSESSLCFIQVPFTGDTRIKKWVGTCEVKKDDKKPCECGSP